MEGLNTEFRLNSTLFSEYGLDNSPPGIMAHGHCLRRCRHKRRYKAVVTDCYRVTLSLG